MRELDVVGRTTLEEALDAFEIAMDSGDRQVFRAARQDLLVKLSAFGFPFDAEEEAKGE